MKKRRKKHKINKLLSLILIITTILSLLLSIALNLLSNKYIVIYAIIIFIINLININLKKKKKFALSNIYSTLILIILLPIMFFIIKTTNVIDSFNKNYTIYNYDVIVLKDTKYKKLEDLKKKKISYYIEENDILKDKLKTINKKINCKYKKENEKDKLYENLLNNETDAIILEDSYLQILKENNEELENKIKIIHKFKMLKKLNNKEEKTNIPKEPFNIYISGIDTYGKIESVSRSDVNMVVTVNPKTNQILLTSIPRDYYIKLHEKKGYNDKLTHAGLYGIDMSINSIEDLLNIKINYYIKVNFTSIIDIVNTLNGVEVYSDYDFTSMDGYKYKKGLNRVNGEEALSFARERKAFSEGDRQRIKDQQHLFEALIKKCTSKNIITKYNSLLNTINKEIMTNLEAKEITSLVKMQIINNKEWNISTNSLDGKDSNNYTYSTPNQKLYVMEPNKESVEEASYLINKIIYGEKLAQEKNNYYDNYEINNVTKEKEETNETEKKETQKEDKKLEASLNKKSYTLVEGEEFIYHGYTATYDNVDITKETDITYIVKGATFDNQSDLITYMSNLTVGTYYIEYKIEYKNEKTTLKEEVEVIKNNFLNNDDTDNDKENNNDNINDNEEINE